MPTQRCQEETSSTDFVMWMEYLEMEVNAFHREDYYLAQIAAEMRRSFVKNPKKVKLDDFLLKFKNKVIRKGMTKEERTKIAKSFWGALTSLSFAPKKKKDK